MNSVTRVLHDKLSQDATGRTMSCQVQEGPINCLALNRDCSQAVVAGRNVFKIFSIEDQEFQERTNLRVGRNINLNYSASDVHWNTVQDNLLASAATNGAVVVWDLNKVSRSKQDHVFTNVHRRSVNKVVFHSHESDMLLSGSQDGFIKLFDLRKKEVASSFHARDGVRDIQYNPHHYFMFAAALDNGNIQIWDMRNTGKCERQFTAHGGPVFSIDWHTSEKMWIATAGRDRLIKVWDLYQSSNKSTYTVQTMASIAKIKWRPQRRFHISSCSLIIDFSINVWDVRRPYIPFASFIEHKDIVTGIVWRPNDPHMFFSSSKDSTIYQHVFKDATRPADKANPVSLDINIHGDVALASSDKGSKNAGYSHSRLPALWKRQQDRGEQFTLVTSVLNEFEQPIQEPQTPHACTMTWFVESAQQYKLMGRPLGELCDHNARVAQVLQRHEIVQTWKMLKALYSAAPTVPTTGPSATSLFTNKSESLDNTVKDTDTERKPEVKEAKVTETDVKEKQADTSTEPGEEDSDVDQSNLDVNGLSSIVQGLTTNINTNFFFSDGEMEGGDIELDYTDNYQDQQEWSLAPEAFPLRQVIEDESAGVGHHLMAGHLSEPSKTGPESPSSANESEMNSKSVHQLVEIDSYRQKIMETPPFMAQIPTWEFTQIVCEMLHSYADKGDVQMAVSVIIVLGERIKPHIDDTTLEQWFMSYIDLLGRFKMWSLATHLIKWSGHPEVGSLNQRSTTFHTHCSRCSKVLTRAGWVCDRCTPHHNTCSICHLPVRGLYIWCQGCSHGGHQKHLRQWFQKSQHCPTGCGHLCEFT